jgi:nitric oxide reductase subunit B
VLISVLPVGLLQTWASVEHGLWYARSAEFLQSGLMDTLRWLRVIGDSIFAFGAVVLGWFVLGLKTGWSVAREPDTVATEFPADVDSEGEPTGVN